MTRFLAGNDLTSAIKSVLSGADVRCAVAYWGRGIEAAFSSSAGPRGARIICDVTRGGTSPKALIDLGAIANKNLRHVPDLHAKVYISDWGAVIGSANASSNGIGFDGAAGLIEAGLALTPDEDAFAQAATWFEIIWQKSRRVDQEALDLATKRFIPSRKPKGRPVRAGSLLDQIAADPDRFSEISIVLAQSEAEPKDRIRARSAMIAAHPEEEDAINRMPDDGMFIGWKRKDLARWRRSFIEFWLPGDKLSCYGRRASYFHDKTGTVMTRKNWRSVRSIVEGDIPNPSTIAMTDVEVVRRLLDEYGDVVFTPHELAVAIEQLA